MEVIATLSAMFKIFDGASGPLSTITSKTDQAIDSILDASGATDKFNQKLQATGASANSAVGGLGKFLSIAALVAGAIKGMSMVDEFTNTSARLNLVNDGLQTQLELEDKIFAAADRSRGSYSDMADAVAKLQMMAGDSFSSNDETIAFTELMQKSFKVGGASKEEQSSAMLQLTQAMASGRLQGDEFSSISESAPLILKAIEKYTEKSRGELRKLSSEGAITSDIIKSAMFAMGEDINTQFEAMPITFAEVWTKITDGATKAFRNVSEKINGLINTDGFMQFIEGVIIGFDLAAKATSWLIDTIIDGWGTIGPILGLISGVMLLGMIAKLWAMIPPLIAQGGAWLALYWPLLVVIGVVAILISAARQFGATWEDIFGFVGGIIGVFAAGFYNQFVDMWNAVAAFINFFGNVFREPVASVQALFYDLAVNVLGFIENMAQGIEDLLNQLPGVNVSITGGITGLKDDLADKVANIRADAGLIEYVEPKEYMDYSEAFVKGNEIGKDVSNSIGDALDKLTKKMTEKDEDNGLGSFGAGNTPTKVKGEGKNGKVNVDMSDEDLGYLRDIAERDYINKFSTATLAPNINIEFGDIRETADANQLVGRIKKILQEEIAMSEEGVYA